MVYLLEKDYELLARMPLIEMDDLGAHCAFEPTPAFAPYQALFDEDALIATQLNEDAPPELVERARELTDTIVNLRFTIRAEDDSEEHFLFLLGISGDRADFRPLDEA